MSREADVRPCPGSSLARKRAALARTAHRPTRSGTAHSTLARRASEGNLCAVSRVPASCMSHRKSFCRMAFQSRPSTGLEAHRTKTYGVPGKKPLRFGLMSDGAPTGLDDGGLLCFGFLSFEIWICFGFRASDFGFKIRPSVFPGSGPPHSDSILSSAVLSFDPLEHGRIRRVVFFLIQWQPNAHFGSEDGIPEYTGTIILSNPLINPVDKPYFTLPTRTAYTPRTS